MVSAESSRGVPLEPDYLEPVVIRMLARQLRDRELTTQPGVPLTELYPQLGLEDAYRIQLEYIALREAEGARVVGHKVGCTNKLLQAQFGINQPDYGHILDAMVLSDGAKVSAASLIKPRIEPELAFVLSRTLKGPNVNALDVLNATRWVLPCFEIIDSRIQDWCITIEDTVADNGSSSSVILGNQPHEVNGTDLRSLGVVIEVNGTVAGTGAGAAVLGHPAQSVAWLANALAPLGRQLQVGHIVLSGALTPSIEVNAGDVVYADFGVFGVIRCQFT